MEIWLYYINFVFEFIEKFHSIYFYYVCFFLWTLWRNVAIFCLALFSFVLITVFNTYLRYIRFGSTFVPNTNEIFFVEDRNSRELKFFSWHFSIFFISNWRNIKCKKIFRISHNDIERTSLNKNWGESKNLLCHSVSSNQGKSLSYSFSAHSMSFLSVPLRAYQYCVAQTYFSIWTVHMILQFQNFMLPVSKY